LRDQDGRDLHNIFDDVEAYKYENQRTAMITLRCAAFALSIDAGSLVGY
jgi:hypothetical protein